jgi:hypothetical protein
MNDQIPIGALLALLGFGVLTFTVRLILRSFATHRWPLVEATILESRVVRERDDGIWYEARLSYAYEVNSQRYVGSLLRGSPSVIWGLPWFAQRVIARYPAGRRVYVAYSPSDPAFAVLERGVNVGWLVGASLVVAALVAGAWNQLSLML